MKHEPQALQSQLTVLRNLAASSFLTLSNSANNLNIGSLREQFPDPALWNRTNGMVINLKKRFDSYRILLQTLTTAVGSEGAIALAESIISYVFMIRSLLEDSELEKIAKPYAAFFEPRILEIIGLLEKDGEVASKETLRHVERFCTQFPSGITAIVVYWFSIQFADRYARAIQLTHSDGLSKIVRELSFPPEYQQAGLAILNYFSAVLIDKYPDIPVAVSIKQEPNLVTLVITLPDGSEDKITQALNDYGLVVTGKMSAKEFISDDLRALALEQKLELAQMEVRQTKEILRLQDQYSNKRVESLEVEVKNLYSLLGREFTSREKLQDGLLKFTETMSNGHIGEQVTGLLNSLSQAIADHNVERTKIILEDIQTAEPDVFERLNDFFLKAATSGIIGNAVYDWLKVLWPMIPK
ncbi:MAG: hypothetical protein V4713_05650 [Pseudomonadota bacterium]